MAAHVVPVPDHASDVDRLDRVALSAARILGQFVDSNQIVGVAWGSTMTAMSRHLMPKPVHNSEIVQLNGSGNMRTTGILYASELLRRFGEAYGAHVQQFPVPAFFDDPDTKRAMWRERSTRATARAAGTMDVAVFGLGSPFAEVPSHVYQGGYLEAHGLPGAQPRRRRGRRHRVLPGRRIDRRHRVERSCDRTRLLGAAPRAARVCVVSGRARRSRACAARSPRGS